MFNRGASDMEPFRSIIVVVALVVIAIFEIQCAKSTDNQPAQASRNNASFKVVDVDVLVRHPEDFKGSIGVTGRVTHLDESKSAFVLGCEDACVALSVRFKGKMPAIGTGVTVYGEVTKAEDAKYIFAAQEIKTE
jgi:hypothetical protein